MSLKLIGYCRQSSYTDSEVVFTLLPAVAWVLKSQFAPGYMHFNKCFEGVSGKRGIFHNGKLAIEVFFLSRPAIDFSYLTDSSSRIASHLIICVISVPFKLSPRYVEHDTLIWEYLNSSIHLAPYLEKKFRKIYEGEAYKFYRQRYE